LHQKINFSINLSSSMRNSQWRFRDFPGFLFLVVIPALTVIGIIIGFIISLLARIFLRISFVFLPMYIKRQSSKGRFLIRFRNPDSQVELSLKQRARVAFSHAWLPFTMSVFILTMAITVRGFEDVASGEGLEFYKCGDGQEILFDYVNDGIGNCDDGSDESDPNPSPCYYPECTGDPLDIVGEKVFDDEWMVYWMISPLLAFITAPMLILRESTIAVVDKENRSIIPIGASAYRTLNTVLGFGSFVLLFDTCWSVASVASDSVGDRMGILFFMAFLMFILLLMLFHILWAYSFFHVKTHVRSLALFEERITQSKEIEIHTFNQTDPGIVTIDPA